MRVFPFNLRGKPKPKAPANRPAAPGGRTPRIYRNGHPAAPADEEEIYGGPGWLTAVDVQKSYRGRKVVKGVSSPRGAARPWACWVPMAPARPPCST